MLPQLAQGDANKVFVIPSEFAEAFSGIGKALGGLHTGGESTNSAGALTAGERLGRAEPEGGRGPGRGMAAA